MSGGLRDRVRELTTSRDPLLFGTALRVRGAAYAARRGHRVRARTVQEYLASTDEPKLHFGAGDHRLDGWLNTDLVKGDAHLDLSRPLPLPDASFAFAFGEHVLEHLSEATGDALLRELYRVLRPGGVVRITTPDLAKLVALYADRHPLVTREAYCRRWLDDAAGRRIERPAQLLNDFMRQWGHLWISDEEDLAARLRAAGFRDVRRHETGESDRPALRGLGRHGGDPWVNRAEAMTLEAVRRPA
jgi:predicted SAM-dependent methyltransferase